MIDPVHLAVVKDHLVLKYLLEHGGQLTMRYDELRAVGEEYDGYAVHLEAGPETFTLTVHSPEREKLSR